MMGALEHGWTPRCPLTGSVRGFGVGGGRWAAVKSLANGLTE